MPQKKKTANKKTNKKSHKKHSTQKQNIILQSIPNYSSEQVSGHQNNKNNIQYAPVMQQESRTDNLVGDLVSKLINKIETDGSQQTQQYSQAIQPINNDNSNSNSNSGQTSGNTQTITNNIYPNSGQAAADTPDLKKTAIETTGSAIAQASGLTAAEAGGIGAGVTAGIGGLIAARNKIGSGIMGAISGIKKGITRAPKSGGSLTNSRLLREHDEVIRGTKPGTYAEIPSAPPSPKIPPANFDKVLSQAKKSEDARTSLTPIMETAGGTGMRTPQRTLDVGTAAAQTRSRLSEEKVRRSFDGLLKPQESPKPYTVNKGGSVLISSPPQPQQLNFRESIWSMPNTPRPAQHAEIRPARTSGIQTHEGVQTREIRRQTGEPHVQMGTQTEKRPRGRPRTQPETQFSARSPPEPGPSRPRGRPRSTMLSQAETPTPARQSVARNVTKSGTRSK